MGKEGSGGPFRELRRVRMAGSGREFHPEGVVGSPPEGMGGVEKDRRCQDTPRRARIFKGLLGGPGGVERAGRGLEAPQWFERG